AMNAATPARTPARVTLTLRDGRKATHERDSQRGDFQDPYTDDELRGKFRDLASLVLTNEGARSVEALVDRCETWPSASVLFEALRAGARS
ncbi:MAG: MmgE/PrpD family protein, partial [Alphaproteobacteria bacterium]|nr:MmgE/PrpD family protein [Alphaproteobacteria bacterium]